VDFTMSTVPQLEGRGRPKEPRQVFSTFSLIVACIVKTRERFMGIGQVLTMPLFFASNAIYPIAMMPDWLKLVAKVNPLTYLVDALRSLMVQSGESAFG
jgi:ABC-2 type transport system permease protein